MVKNESPGLSQNLSSNTLFHFTKSFDRLKNILINGFKLSYVLEILPKKTQKGKSLCYIAPMVCFCDIPLGTVKVHLRRYGNYGLGIHKNFCKRANINPVFYIHSSKTFNYILPEPIGNFSLVIPYIKKYREETKRGKFKLYNEREWRYVKSKEAEILNEDMGHIRKRCAELNKGPVHYLSVRPDYVEYIIVENKSEISKAIDFINENITIPEQEKKILYTKIISATRIKYDF